MNLHEIHKKFGTSGLVLIVLLALLLMLVFGYQLAHYETGEQIKQRRAGEATRAALEDENRQLQTALSQRTAALELAKMDVEEANRMVAEREQEIAEIREQLGFYQQVMAPEMTQDGFFVDGITITPAASPGYFHMGFVLLQQRTNKAVIKGEMQISVSGSLNGKPHTFTSGESAFMPDGPVIYRFKFFQKVDISFSLPTDFQPETLTFATTVYQYTTRRGYYEKTMPWQRAVAEASAKN